eukprot:scaffold11890_cov112-Isochrysis_galbana.AAC.1
MARSCVVRASCANASVVDVIFLENAVGAGSMGNRMPCSRLPKPVPSRGSWVVVVPTLHFAGHFVVARPWLVRDVLYVVLVMSSEIRCAGTMGWRERWCEDTRVSGQRVKPSLRI